jgi:hypothetical protein
MKTKYSTRRFRSMWMSKHCSYCFTNTMSSITWWWCTYNTSCLILQFFIVLFIFILTGENSATTTGWWWWAATCKHKLFNYNKIKFYLMWPKIRLPLPLDDEPLPRINKLRHN